MQQTDRLASSLHCRPRTRCHPPPRSSREAPSSRGPSLAALLGAACPRPSRTPARAVFGLRWRPPTSTSKSGAASRLPGVRFPAGGALAPGGRAGRLSAEPGCRLLRRQLRPVLQAPAQELCSGPLLPLLLLLRRFWQVTPTRPFEFRNRFCEVGRKLLFIILALQRRKLGLQGFRELVGSEEGLSLPPAQGRLTDSRQWRWVSAGSTVSVWGLQPTLSRLLVYGLAQHGAVSLGELIKPPCRHRFCRCLFTWGPECSSWSGQQGGEEVVLCSVAGGGAVKDNKGPDSL